MTALYLVEHQIKFKHKKINQLHWAKYRLKCVNRITRLLFNLDLTSPKLDSHADITNRRAPHFLLKTMHGITVPKTPKQALELDLVNNNHFWRDAIGKEIDTMREYNVFSPIHKDRVLKCADGWQFPLYPGFLLSKQIYVTRYAWSWVATSLMQMILTNIPPLLA